jgi:hypothetical protein
MPIRGTICEKSRRLVAFEFLHRRRLLGAWRREGGNKPGQLACHSQTLPTGGKHPHARTGVQEDHREACYSIDEVLAIIKDEEHLFVCQGVE